MCVVTEVEAAGIVVGIDGSSGSRAALEWALQTDADLGEVVPVAAWHTPWWTATLAGAAAPVRYYKMEHDVDAMLSEIVDTSTSGRLGEPIVAHGGAPTVLLEAAKDRSLLVVGSRGHGALADTILGSVSIACSLRATTPMAVVPDHPLTADGPCVVGVDGSCNSVAALVWAMRHGPAGSPVIAINAWEPFVLSAGSVPASAYTAIEEASMATVESAVAKACEIVPGAPVPESISSCGDPRTILEAAAAGASMIVVGAHGDGGVPTIVLGSVATAMLHRPVCPIVVVPEPVDGA